MQQLVLGFSQRLSWQQHSRLLKRANEVLNTCEFQKVNVSLFKWICIPRHINSTGPIAGEKCSLRSSHVLRLWRFCFCFGAITISIINPILLELDAE